MAGDRIHWNCRGLVLAIGIAMAAGARADLTVKDLTGTAVSEAGPYVTDVQGAIALFGRSDFAGTLRLLEQAKKATPILAPAEVMMATLHFSANQTSAGYAMLEKAMLAAPSDPEPPLMLIEHALVENRLTEAALLMPQVEKLLAGFSENPRRKQNLQSRFYLNGAVVDQSRQNLDAAQAKLEALVKLDTSNATAHQRLGQVYMAKYDQGDAQADKLAYEEFKQAANLDTSGLPADLMMAMLSKDPAKAAVWVEFALKNNPSDPRTEVGATNHYLKAGKLDKAQQHAAQAIMLDKDGFESNLLSGITEQVAGNYAKAVEHLSQAYLLQPTKPSVTNQLAMALLEKGGEENQNRALTFAELNARMHPSNLDVMATLGWINYRLKRMAAADRAFDSVLSTPLIDGRLNISNDTTFILAYLTAMQRKKNEAAQMLHSILDNKQLFAYRPQAEKLLAEVAKLPTAAGTNSAKPQAAPAAKP